MDSKKHTVKGACPHDCPDQCGWEVTVEGGRALEVVGDRSHPFTEGALCSKLKRFTARVYSDKRILHPLRRVGAKGEAGFERVSWDDALADIGAKLKETIAGHGPLSVMPYSFAGTIGLLQRYAGDLFFRRLGATAVEGDYCGNVAYAGVADTNGAGVVGVLPEDLVASRFIILWGTNTVVTNLHMWSAVIRKAKQRGAKIVVIDPVKTRTARVADWYLQIQPGTDAALALGMMHVIVRDGLHDNDYIDRYTVGFDQLQERLTEYPPERVAAITGLPATEIELLAAEFAVAKPAVIRLLVGMERHVHGSMAFRTIACLPALTGAWRELGGGLCQFTIDLFNESLNLDAIWRPDRVAEPPRSIHIAQLGRALTGELDPPINCLFVYNSNPVVSAPNQNLVMQGLAREDLFTVVHEQFMTDTARYADYVLPAATQIEHFDLMPSWGQTYLALNKPAIEPVGEAMANTELFRRLARVMAYDDDYLYISDEEKIRQILDSNHPYLNGITYERLENDGWARLELPAGWRPLARGAFKTASGKCEFYSEQLAARGIDPLPTYLPISESDETNPTAELPLLLVSAKTAHHALNSEYINLQAKNSTRVPALEINEVDAQSRDIATGDLVKIFNQLGEVEVRANVSDHTPSGVVSMAFNWWPGDSENGSSANALTLDGLSSIGIGSNAFDTRVEVVLRA